MFEWLENTSVALWVGESLWAYPFMLSLHVIGLAIVVGILSMVDFKLLGGFKGIRSRIIPAAGQVRLDRLSDQRGIRRFSVHFASNLFREQYRIPDQTGVHIRRRHSDQGHARQTRRSRSCRNGRRRWR